MITRYNANFQDHMIEVDPEGRFVKYADYAQAELLIDIKVEENLAEKLKAEREELQALKESTRLLTSANEQLDSQLRELSDSHNHLVSHHAQLIKSAKDRLNLHGHAPTCGTRYKATTPDGQVINGECSCGLEEWMIESGVRNG